MNDEPAEDRTSTPAGDGPDLGEITARLSDLHADAETLTEKIADLQVRLEKRVGEPPKGRKG